MDEPRFPVNLLLLHTSREYSFSSVPTFAYFFSPMRHPRFVLPCLATLSILATSVFADVIVLKSGERVEGKVLSETDKAVTINVQVTPSIADERVIQKSDITKMTKVSPDEEAYQALMNVQPGPNSLAPAQYAQIIGQLKGFIKTYPTSLHIIDIQGTINGFEAEKKRVQAGEVKLNNEWLNKQQTQIQRIQVGGAFSFEAMKSQAAAGDLVGALNSFVAIEKTYAGARCYPEAVELAKKILPQLSSQVANALVNERIDKAALEKGWKDAAPKDRAEMMASYQRDVAAAEAATTAATTANLWPPLAKISPKSLQALQTKITSETSRLAAIPVTSIRGSVQRSDNAERMAASGDNTEALAAAKDALTMWPVNEAAKRLETTLNKR